MISLPKWPPRRGLLFITLVSTLFTLHGCGGALFKVKPVVELPPLPDSARSASGNGITFRVAPLLADEESQELFEANLPVAGLLPVRLEMVYDGGQPVEIKRARFRLRDSEDREWTPVSVKQATSRILKSNEIYAYNPNSRKRFEKELASYDIDLKTPLTANERRQGFLFFQAPDKEPVKASQGFTLIVERLPQPIVIKIN